MARFGKYGRIDPRNPQAAGVCDRGGEVRKLSELMWEMRWAGDKLERTGFRCCRYHIDPPHPQDRTPPICDDPQPVRDPRPELD